MADYAWKEPSGICLGTWCPYLGFLYPCSGTTSTLIACPSLDGQGGHLLSIGKEMSSLTLGLLDSGLVDCASCEGNWSWPCWNPTLGTLQMEFLGLRSLRHAWVGGIGVGNHVPVVYIGVVLTKSFFGHSKIFELLPSSKYSPF